MCVCACLAVCWDCVQGLLCTALTLVKLPGSHIPPSVQDTAGTKQTLSDHCNPTFRRFLALGNCIACSKAETQGEGIGGRGGEQGKRARPKEKRTGSGCELEDTRPPPKQGLWSHQLLAKFLFTVGLQLPLALRHYFFDGAQVTDLVYFWCITFSLHGKERLWHS